MTASFQMVSDHAWTGSARDRLASRCRRHLAVPDPDDRGAVPDRSSPAHAIKRDPRSFVVWMLVLEAACLGSFVSLDLVLFFVFFELTLVPVYFVIAGWGFERRSAAAVKFFLYTFFGSAFLLVGIIVLAVAPRPADRQAHVRPGRALSDAPELTAQILMFLAFTAAFAVKAPVFPFHTWSPDAYAESPTVGFGRPGGRDGQARDLRDHPVRPDVSSRGRSSTSPHCCSRSGSSGSSTGRSSACAQRDLKRLVAYSSLSHIGLHRARHVRAHDPGARRAACCRWSTTAS